RSHILHATSIPVVQCDRGGQVTYHGPGQLTLYGLFNLRRYGLFVRDYVRLIEDVLINMLHELDVPACRMPGAPGVYVPAGHSAHELNKLAALGIRVSKGCTYHGLSLNVDMDLTPFSSI